MTLPMKRMNRVSGFRYQVSSFMFEKLTWMAPMDKLRDSMQETIEKLLILQDRDRKILRVQQELAHIAPERETLRAQRRLDAIAARLRQRPRQTNRGRSQAARSGCRGEKDAD